MSGNLRQQTLELARRHLIPGRVTTFGNAGLDLVIGRREGYRFWDIDGREFHDLHLNGGTYNLGHRHPAIVQALKAGCDQLDIGNHHLPSVARSELAAALARLSPAGGLRYTVFTAGAGEAVDVTIRSARYATGNVKIVTLDSAYHGRTGLSGAAGDPTTAEYFHSALPDQFVRVPWGDVGAVEEALRDGDIAAVLLETIPATAGFPTTPAGYHQAIGGLCDRYQVPLIADEVQTGLGRTGALWAIEHFEVVPDAMVIGKGLSGGMYPMAGAMLSDRLGAWLQDNGWGHVSTFGGAELGCVVALKALELSSADDTLAHARRLGRHLAEALGELRDRHPALVQVQQECLIIGLRFNTPGGAMSVMKALFDRGVWAFFAGFDPAVLQFKPGLLLSLEEADRVLERLDDALVHLPVGDHQTV